MYSEILNELRCVYGAAFNVFNRRCQCLRKIQIPMLRLIYNWYCKPSEPPVFWLQGMAGTLKSTIACTVANALQDGRLLTEDSYLSDQIFLRGGFFLNKNINMYQRVLKASFLGTGGELVLKENVALINLASVAAFISLVFGVGCNPID